MGEGPSSDDLAGGTVPSETDKLSKWRVSLVANQVFFRQILFWVAIALILIFLAIAFGTAYYLYSYGALPTFSLALVLAIVLAAPTVVCLALMRALYRDPLDKPEDSSGSLLLDLAREIVKLVKKDPT